MDISLLTRYFNDWNGGIGVYSKNILREMIDRGHNVDPHSTRTKGIVGYFKYVFLELQEEIKLPSPFSKHPIDVYHALTPMEGVHLPKERTVTTFHDLMPMLHRKEETWYFNGIIGKFKRWAGSKWFEYVAREGVRSRGIICNSEHTKNTIVEHLGADEERITVTRLGIDEELEPKSGDKYKNKSYTVGTLSYLDSRKRIDILIRAFRRIDDGDAELLIPSTGPDEERLREVAGSDDRIKFLGYIPEEDKADYLSSLDVFVLPSKLEGYGLPWVEAMACKTPVVSLTDAIIPEDVKKRTHSVSSVRLSRLLSEQSFDCDIDANYEFAMKHDWEKCAEETEKVYKEVAE